MELIQGQYRCPRCGQRSHKENTVCGICAKSDAVGIDPAADWNKPQTKIEFVEPDWEETFNSSDDQ